MLIASSITTGDVPDPEEVYVSGGMEDGEQSTNWQCCPAYPVVESMQSSLYPIVGQY